MTDALSDTAAASEWAHATLGDLFEIQQGKALSPRARRGVNPRRFLRTANVLWGRLSLATLDTMDFSPEEQGRYRLEPKDLLVCEGGEIGRTAEWNGEVDDCYYQNHLHRLRASRADVDPSFFAFWMQYAFLIGRRYVGHANETTIANLSRSRLAAFEVPHPPLTEQRAIAHILRTIELARDQTEQVTAAARELKTSLRRHLLRFGTERLDQVSDAAERQQTDQWDVPASWDVCELGDVATLQRGRDLPVAKRKPGPYPVIGSNGIVGTHSEPSVSGPGVLVGRSGSVGKVVWSEREYWPLNTTLWVKDFHGNDPRFIFHLLSQFDFRAYASGVSVPTLNRNVVHPVRVGVPSVSEQRQISVALDAADRKIDAETGRGEALGALFTSVLRGLMTGAIRVSAKTPAG